MLEAALQIAGEFILQVCGEALLELGLHALAEPFLRPPKPWLAALGYALFGAIFGALSLLVLPVHLVGQPWRVVNLIGTPIAAGLVMTAMGAWRARRGDALLRIDRFWYGYLFALTLALVRFGFAD